MNKSRLWNLLKEYFLLGLISIFPLVLTLWVLLSIIGFLDRKFYDLIPGVNSPQDIFGVDVPGLGILLTLMVILVAGVLAKTFSGKIIKQILESWVGRVPLVRGLYKASKQIGGIFFSKEPSSFKKVVYVPFPYPSVQTIGFITNAMPNGKTFVYVPTAPNPTSGYILLFNNADIQECLMSVEEALQFVISGGAILPNFMASQVPATHGAVQVPGVISGQGPKNG